jgi:hypothetical protein
MFGGVKEPVIARVAVYPDSRRERAVFQSGPRNLRVVVTEDDEVHAVGGFHPNLVRRAGCSSFGVRLWRVEVPDDAYPGLGLQDPSGRR